MISGSKGTGRNGRGDLKLLVLLGDLKFLG